MVLCVGCCDTPFAVATRSGTRVQEARLVEAIVVGYSDQYVFLTADDRSSRVFRELYDALVRGDRAGRLALEAS